MENWIKLICCKFYRGFFNFFFKVILVLDSFVIFGGDLEIRVLKKERE